METGNALRDLEILKTIMEKRISISKNFPAGDRCCIKRLENSIMRNMIG